MVTDVTDRHDFRRRVDDAVLVLFALVAESIGWATVALLEQDVERAEHVIEDDRGIDERCQELAGLVKERLSASVLPPDELEDLIAILQIIPELERSADLAEHIAQRALRSIGGVITPRSRGLIQYMSDLAVRMWQNAGKAYRHRSRDAGFTLREADDELDELAASLVAEGAAAGADPAVAAELALIARFYERLGDHAVNLARRVDSMAAPRRLNAPQLPRKQPKATVPKSDSNGSPAEKSGRFRRFLRVFNRFRLVPSDDAFYELFDAAATNARDCAEALGKLIASFADLDEHFTEIKAFERRGDEITVQLLRRLDASFVTPFDREDIHALTEELDDVVDEIFSAASLIQMVQADEPLPDLVELPELAETLIAMTDELVALMGCMRKREGARYRLERVEHLERQGDAIFRRGMARLLSGEYEPLDVIRWKDIVEALESAANSVEDVSDVVESILVKTS